MQYIHLGTTYIHTTLYLAGSNQTKWGGMYLGSQGKAKVGGAIVYSECIVHIIPTYLPR